MTSNRRSDKLMSSYAPAPLMLVRGEGSYVWDDDARRYLDLTSGLGVTSIGHAHPAVTRAISAQASKVVHVSNQFASEHQGPVAKGLDRLIGGGGQVFFGNSGAEANEAAIKLARKWAGWGRHTIVSTYGSFHGRTLATLHATGQPEKHEPFQPLPEGFRHVALNDTDALERALDESVCAIMLEPIQGEGGVNPVSAEYFQVARRLCDERGLLLIVDEVQTGLGRTGKWFGFQHLDATPDVVTVAKALGNGLPVGACWATKEVSAAFGPGDHGSTFGGQPLVMAAAAAVLDVLESEDAPARAARAGKLLRDGLDALDGAVEVRGRGLLLAVGLRSADARSVVADLRTRGVIVNLLDEYSIRLAPSLLITEEEIDCAVAAFGEVL